MSRNLTKKQRGFIADYLKTGNGVQAALNNYETNEYHVAGNIASENLEKPQILSVIEMALNDEMLAEKHKALLDKKEIVTKWNYETGELMSVETGQIDAQAVAKGLDMAYKLKGSYAAEKNINVNVDAKTANEMISKEIARFRATKQ